MGSKLIYKIKVVTNQMLSLCFYPKQVDVNCINCFWGFSYEHVWPPFFFWLESIFVSNDLKSVAVKILTTKLKFLRKTALT